MWHPWRDPIPKGRLGIIVIICWALLIGAAFYAFFRWFPACRDSKTLRMATFVRWPCWIYGSPKLPWPDPAAPVTRGNDWSTTFLYPKITMPMIMIQCPTFKRAVPTGLTTENIKLDSLSGLAIPFQCPVCLKTHRWEREQAWVEEATIWGSSACHIAAFRARISAFG
jgi:hypothetical protein